MGRSYRTPLVACTIATSMAFGAGCGSRAATPPRTGDEASALEPESVLRAVAALRGLSPRASTRIELLTDDEFRRVLDRKMTESRFGEPAEPSPSEGKPFEQIVQAATREARALQSEQTIGFYDEARDVIFLRKGARSDESRLPLSWVLAHEVTHALQHQHFAIPDRSKIHDSDARLALSAVLEGDAMISMLAFGARQAWFPMNRVVAVAIRELDRGGTFDEASAMTGAVRTSAHEITSGADMEPVRRPDKV
jgi:hypothetical protein